MFSFDKVGLFVGTAVGFNVGADVSKLVGADVVGVVVGREVLLLLVLVGLLVRRVGINVGSIGLPGPLPVGNGVGGVSVGKGVGGRRVGNGVF